MPTPSRRRFQFGSISPIPSPDSSRPSSPSSNLSPFSFDSSSSSAKSLTSISTVASDANRRIPVKSVIFSTSDSPTPERHSDTNISANHSSTCRRKRGRTNGPSGGFIIGEPKCLQEALTKYLQILHLLHGSDLAPPGTYLNYHHRERNKKFEAELRVLDMVAVLLTTGEDDDVTAVSLDKRNGLELVIAKNRPPTPADDAAVKNLISVLLNNPNDSDPKSIFPSVMTYCIKNINKRLFRLNQSISHFLLIIEQELQRYSPSQSVDDELPGSKVYLDKFYPDSKPEVKVIISELFQFCFTHSQCPLDSHDKDGSYKTYSDLCLGADVLVQSCFLKNLTGHYNLKHYEKVREVEKLQRRLVKVCRYLDDIVPLVRGAKRWFRSGEIPYRWVDASTSLHLREELVEISPSFKDSLRWSPIRNCARTIQHISEKYPSLFERWSSSVRTCIHPEIQIIADFGPPMLTCYDRGTNVQAIGCSKRCCFCCMIWIRSFNLRFLTSWITSKPHEKAYANWELPRLAYKLDEEKKHEIDTNVMRAVACWLGDWGR